MLANKSQPSSDIQRLIIAITEDRPDKIREINLTDEQLIKFRFEDKMNILNISID